MSHRISAHHPNEEHLVGWHFGPPDGVGRANRPRGVRADPTTGQRVGARLATIESVVAASRAGRQDLAALAFAARRSASRPC